MLDLIELKEMAGCKPFSRGTLFADTREKGGVLDFVNKRCERAALRFQQVQLPTGCGDYYFEFIDEEQRLLNAGFERKTFEDFYRSIVNGSLTLQVQSLVDNVDFPFLLLSGSLDVVDYTHYDLVLGTIGAVAAEYGMTVVSNLTDAQLATVLVATVENLHLNKHRIGIRARRKDVDLRIQFLINAFEGVGEKTAQAILDTFGTVDAVISTIRDNPIAFAERVKGISAKRAMEFQGIVIGEKIVARGAAVPAKRQKKHRSASHARRKRRYARKSK